MRFLWLPLLQLFAMVAQGAAPRATFTENKGQWPASVLYRVMLPSGALFVEREAFTYVLQKGGAAHHHVETGTGHVDDPLMSHAFRVHFEGGHASGTVGGSRQGHYENFFLGDDPAHWGTGCGIFGEVVLKEVWPGIDLRLDGRTGLKYELIIAPGADPAQARFRYEGQDGLELKDGALIVTTSAGALTEAPPFSFQANGGIVGSGYTVSNNLVSFDLGAFDHTLPLTIDPTLTFSSFSGSSGDNFGFTATYDAAGHLYGGGIVFGVGYPITLGALDDSFSGGTIDVGISKWSIDGSTLEWSTYLGGSGNESPHSMVVNENNELFVFGSTGSDDMPVTAGCYDATFGGGDTLVFIVGYAYGHADGSDIFVAHLNNTATALIGCTYVGGPENDGITNDPALAHNYGDSFRGEIIMDLNGRPVVASATASQNLQVVGGPQVGYGGGIQDGYCFRLDPELTTMLWSTYIGGSGMDAAYGVQTDSNGELFVTGGTTSTNLPMTGVPFKANSSGSTDGFIMRYGVAGTFLGSTYLGTANYDQSYFVQLNTADEVFVVGQTTGSYPITTGKYAVPGSSQFIHKLSHSLATSEWSTCFGNGSIDQSLSPTAFLVSNCGQIYFSGWAGVVNANADQPQSTTNGMEVTTDAFQATTDGSDMYLMLLEPEGVGLSYATFFGGATSLEHVDGGTSRFDKNGTIYQAVCAGCLSNDDFPTSPNAWSETNGSLNCNLGVFKFDLAQAVASIAIDGPSTICLPGNVQFINTSSGGDSYFWSFGDGGTSTELAPAHLYIEEGSFIVSMVLTDSYGCSIGDTTDIQVTAIDIPDPIIPPVGAVCPGDSVQVTVPAGTSWAWFPSVGVSDTTLAAPMIRPPFSMVYQVIVANQCGADTVEVPISIAVPVGSAGLDAVVCLGSGVQLNASGGGSYAWSPAELLSDTTDQSPIATPTGTSQFTVAITTPLGCLVLDTVLVTTYVIPPLPVLEDTLICTGSFARLVADDGSSYSWQPVPGITQLTVQDPIVSPTEPTWYIVLVNNGCGSLIDSAFVDVIVPVADAWPDSVVCPNEPVLLSASGGIAYEWSPAQGLDDPAAQSPMATVSGPATYTVTSTDAFGCRASASLVLGTHPLSFVSAGNDRVIDFGDDVQLAGTGQGELSWAPPYTLSCVDCVAPFAKPLETTTYTITLTDINGCKVRDAVTVFLNGSLFVPNTFTPNGDDVNDVFGAWGKEIKTLSLMIFNRWGELIWTGGSLEAEWDGTYSGKESPIDTYVWRIDVEELAGTKRTLYGHVNLVR